MSFYEKSCREPFLSEQGRCNLTKIGVRVIPVDEANPLVPTLLFDSVAVEGGILALPKADMINVPIPYEPLDHEEHNIDGISLERIVEDHVNKFFSDRKYLVSARRDVFLALEFNHFSYEILFDIQSGHLTTPLIMFDDSKDKAVFFEYDLAINTLSVKREYASELLFGKEPAFWVDYFNKNFLNGISYNENHIGIVRRYYGSIIKGLDVAQR